MAEFVLDAALLCRALDAVSAEMTANRDYLVELDSRAGDGDLGAVSYTHLDVYKRQVHHQLKSRHVQHRVVKRLLTGRHQLRVDGAEFFLFIFPAHKGFHRADGHQPLLYLSLIHILRPSSFSSFSALICSLSSSRSRVTSEYMMVRVVSF